MADDTQKTVASYRVEPEHFGSTAERALWAVLNFAIAFVVLAIVLYSREYAYRWLADWQRRPCTNAELCAFAAVGAFLCTAWLGWWNLRGRRYELEVLQNGIRRITQSTSDTFFSYNIASISEVKESLVVPGLRVRGYHADLFIPRGVPGYEKLKEQIEALKTQ